MELIVTSWEKSSVQTKHVRMRRRIIKPSLCPLCGEKKKLTLANIDHEYREHPAEWFYLCYKCHRHYDIENDNYKFYKKFNALFSHK